MNHDLLWALLIALLVGFVMLRRWRRGSSSPERNLRAKGVRTGPVAGYAWVPSRALNLKNLETLLDDETREAWRFITFETCSRPEGGRQRAVLRASFADDPSREVAFLRALELARAFQLLTQVDAMIVEWHRHAKPVRRALGRVLLAPDGRGWDEPETPWLCIEDIRTGEPHGWEAIPGTPKLKGAGWYMP